MALIVSKYNTPHQETLSENGALPTRIHYVVKNSSFVLELEAAGFLINPESVVARIANYEQSRMIGASALPEEPLTYSVRKGNGGTVLVDLRLNVLSSQFTNGVFNILIEATEASKTLQVCCTC